MNRQFERTALLIGQENIERLRAARVAVFGVGGVGGYAAEALARSGVGSFVLTDNDVVGISNLNRQVIALNSTVGRLKTDVMKERILDINPGANVECRNVFFLPECSGEFDFTGYDYVVDAVDTVTAKIEIIVRSREAGVPVISSMGTGNRLDPSAFFVTDIYSTDTDPLARVMRRELKKRGIESLKVVCSSEKPLRPEAAESGGQGSDDDAGSGARRHIPGSTPFCPPAAGLLLASEVVKDLISF